jgi:DNA-binding MarR family transcriptional regulator
MRHDGEGRADSGTDGCASGGRARGRVADERTSPQAREADEVTVAVMAAAQTVLAISARALARTDASLTLPQLRVLVVLKGRGPVKLVSLAATLAVNPSTAMRMVGRLESGGLVERRPNPADRREVIVRLTEAGGSLVEEVMEHRRAEVAGLVARLPAKQRAGLVPALRALTAAVEAATPGERDEDPFDAVRRVGGLVDDPLDPAPKASDAPEPGGRTGRAAG